MDPILALLLGLLVGVALGAVIGVLVARSRRVGSTADADPRLIEASKDSETTAITPAKFGLDMPNRQSATARKARRTGCRLIQNRRLRATLGRPPARAPDWIGKGDG